MTPLTFKLNFRHLTPDGRELGVRHADSELASVEAGQLREILRAMEKAVAQQSPSDPAAPEIRITSPHGVFMVKTANGRLRRAALAERYLPRMGGADPNAGPEPGPAPFLPIEQEIDA